MFLLLIKTMFPCFPEASDNTGGMKVVSAFESRLQYVYFAADTAKILYVSFARLILRVYALAFEIVSRYGYLQLQGNGNASVIGAYRGSWRAWSRGALNAKCCTTSTVM